MDVTEAIRLMLKKSGKTASSVSESIGRHRAYLSNTLNAKSDIQTSNLARVAKACGFRLSLNTDSERIDIDERGNR